MSDGLPDATRFGVLRERMESAGIVPYGAGCFFAREGDFFDAAVRDAQRRQLVALIECYGAAGVGPVTVFGPVPPSANSAENERRWALAVDFLRALVEAAERAGVVLAVHTLTNSVFNRYSTVERMLSEIDSRALGVCYDVAIHTQLGDNVASDLALLGDRAPLLHMRTVRDVTPAPAFRIHEGRLEASTSEGRDVDFPATVRALLRADYEGILSLEHQRGATAYARVVGYLKGLIEALNEG
jgi:sugar phosphate isomerase/epimerase